MVQMEGEEGSQVAETYCVGWWVDNTIKLHGQFAQTGSERTMRQGGQAYWDVGIQMTGEL